MSCRFCEGVDFLKGEQWLGLIRVKSRLALPHLALPHSSQRTILKLTCSGFWHESANFGVKKDTGLTELVGRNKTGTKLCEGGV
jgi:hypothetical protein